MNLAIIYKRKIDRKSMYDFKPLYLSKPYEEPSGHLVPTGRFGRPSVTVRDPEHMPIRRFL